MLPEVRKVALQPNFFPTTWQAVIFRNYGFVPTKDLAEVLGCSEAVLTQEASRLGLKEKSVDSNWRTRGYITLVRNNWFLLPYDQMCSLLNIDMAQLDFILQNDDFLSVKLGGYKPYCENVKYYPLDSEQIKETKELSKKISYYTSLGHMSPFSFFADKEEVNDEIDNKGTRIVHGYLSPCGDVFIKDSIEYMPDQLLKQYQVYGVNGIWLHGVLSTLSPYPFDESLCKDYPVRRKHLQELIDRCNKYGIKVYLYFNEPRALPEEKFGKYGRIKGRRENGYAALCFEQNETQEYLYNAVRSLLTDVKGLGGIITITMSENLTHCNYRPDTNCPVCKGIPPERSAAFVNNIIQKAITDSGSNTELIANLWGWSPFMGWSEEQTLRGVELLDKKISVMCVSEYDLNIEKGGVKSKIIDYSISNPGPSEITIKTLKKAADEGHKLYAKIQANNSWECSAVPYLPVFDLLYEHLQNLSYIGVNDYMLTWTLGGYPSPMLGMAADYANNRDFSLDAWYKKEYGENSEIVKEAVRCFCKGFREYPFSIESLYFSPKTLGCANSWDLDQEEKQSTMVCYSFDDYENWITPYPIETYLNQYEKLLKEWENGCEILEKNNINGELLVFSKVAYTHFKADYLQTKFSYLKRDIARNRAEIIEVLEEEKINAQCLLSLIYEDGRVGFEASNHYYYTDRNIIEKIIFTNKLIKTI